MAVGEVRRQPATISGSAVQQEHKLASTSAASQAGAIAFIIDTEDKKPEPNVLKTYTSHFPAAVNACQPQQPVPRVSVADRSFSTAFMEALPSCSAILDWSRSDAAGKDSELDCTSSWSTLDSLVRSRRPSLPDDSGDGSVKLGRISIDSHAAQGLKSIHPVSLDAHPGVSLHSSACRPPLLPGDVFSYRSETVHAHDPLNRLTPSAPLPRIDRKCEQGKASQPPCSNSPWTSEASAHDLSLQDAALVASFVYKSEGPVDVEDHHHRERPVCPTSFLPLPRRRRLLCAPAGSSDLHSNFPASDCATYKHLPRDQPHDPISPDESEHTARAAPPGPLMFFPPVPAFRPRVPRSPCRPREASTNKQPCTESASTSEPSRTRHLQQSLSQTEAADDQFGDAEAALSTTTEAPKRKRPSDGTDPPTDGSWPARPQGQADTASMYRLEGQQQQQGHGEHGLRRNESYSRVPIKRFLCARLRNIKNNLIRDEKLGIKDVSDVIELLIQRTGIDDRDHAVDRPTQAQTPSHQPGHATRSSAVGMDRKDEAMRH